MSNIEDITEMVLLEANTRKGKDLVSDIYAVMQDLENDIIRIIANLRIEEREKEDDKSKGIVKLGNLLRSEEGRKKENENQE